MAEIFVKMEEYVTIDTREFYDNMDDDEIEKMAMYCTKYLDISELMKNYTSTNNDKLKIYKEILFHLFTTDVEYIEEVMEEVEFLRSCRDRNNS